MSNSKICTEYANTDFDLKSSSPFDTLYAELRERCSVLHYTAGDDGNWHASVEAAHDEDSRDRDAAADITAILCALSAVSQTAKVELAGCYLREFNIGFKCGDDWAFEHRLPQNVVQAVAQASCSIAVTLYPMRDADGTQREPCADH